MIFRVTSEHIKRQNRKSAYVALFFVLLCVGCIVALISEKSISGMILPAIGFLLFLPPIFRTYRTIQDGAGSYPVIELNEGSGNISVSHKDVVVTVDITQIKNLRLQHKADRIASVIVTTSSGEVMRLEGYENLDALADSLKRLTPSDRITNANIYHR